MPAFKGTLTPRRSTPWRSSSRPPPASSAALRCGARGDDAAAIAEVHARTWQAAYEHVFGAERLAASSSDVASGDASSRTSGRRSSPRPTAASSLVSVGPSRDDDADGELYATTCSRRRGARAPARADAAGLDAMRAPGYRDAVLCVLDDNPRARRFYEREGWALDGDHEARRVPRSSDVTELGTGGL